MEIHLRGFLRISLENKEDFEFELGVVGLGYVGLPLAVETANNNLNVLGYDINSERVENINKGKSPIEDISDNELSKSFFISSASTNLPV